MKKYVIVSLDIIEILPVVFLFFHQQFSGETTQNSVTDVVMF